MKTLPLLSLVILFAFPASAQIGKGTILTGLDLNYSTSKDSYYTAAGAQVPGRVTSTNFLVNPEVGFFINDHWTIGLGAGYTSSKDVDQVHGGFLLIPRTTTKVIAITSRYYAKLGDKVYFFLQGELSWGKGTLSYTSNDTLLHVAKNPTSVFEAGVRPGIVYFITKRIGLETTIGLIGYEYLKAHNDAYLTGLQNNTRSFGVTLNSSTINFGVRYYITKQKPTT